MDKNKITKDRLTGHLVLPHEGRRILDRHLLIHGPQSASKAWRSPRQRRRAIEAKDRKAKR